MKTLWTHLLALINYSIFRPYYKNSVGFIGLQGHEKVMDFGCGVGASSMYIMRKLNQADAHLTCVDKSKTAVKIARRKLGKHKNVDFFTGDIRQMKIDSNTFDVVYMSFVLYHIKKQEREEILDELNRVLKVNGLFILVTPIRKKGLTFEYVESLMRKCNFEKKGAAFFRTLNIFPSYRGIFSPAK